MKRCVNVHHISKSSTRICLLFLPPLYPSPSFRSQREVRSSQQIVFSEYLQMLTALAVGLGLHTVLTSPPHPPHFTTPPLAQEWEWLKKFYRSGHWYTCTYTVCSCSSWYTCTCNTYTVCSCSSWYVDILYVAVQAGIHVHILYVVVQAGIHVHVVVQAGIHVYMMCM